MDGTALTRSGWEAEFGTRSHKATKRRRPGNDGGGLF